MRICIELRRDVNPNIILNQLYKHTQLQDTFGVIMLALVDNQPKILNILDMLKYYLLHQEDVVTRRTKYDLNKAEERAHILEGLMVALDNIDRVISIIRGSQNVQIAKESLMAEFALSDAQSQAIVDMRLRALTGLEREKLEAELKDLLAKIAEYKEILADKKKLLGVIKQEISLIADKYGDDRRTSIGFDEYDLSMEDLIPDEPVVIARTTLGYIKRMTPDNFKSQNRGGKGVKCYKITEKTGNVIGAKAVNEENEIMMITTEGIIIRTPCSGISVMGRITSGVKLMDVDGEIKVASIAKVRDKEASEETPVSEKESETASEKTQE